MVQNSFYGFWFEMADFLSLKKEAFGLEITDASIRMMRLARRNGRLVAVAAGCAELEKGIIKDGNIKDEEKLAVEIKKLTARVAGEKKARRYAVMSLPECKAFLQVIPMPKLNPEEMRAAVVFEAENYVPLPLEKVYLDFEKVSSVFENGPREARLAPAGNSSERASLGAGGRRCEVAVAALPREIVDARVRVADLAGLAPIAMELESQAAVRAALDGKNLDDSAMIIQIGDAQSNVIIYARGSIRFTFSIPISNRYFLETICARVNANIEQAESLKSKFGIEEFVRANSAGKTAGGEKREIFEALIPGLVDFVQQIQKCIQYYQTHDDSAVESSKEDFHKALICGSGSDLKGLDEFFALKLGLPVERAILSVEVNSSDAKRVDLRGGDATGCAVVAGLAIRALEIELNACGGKPAKKNSLLNHKLKK